MLPVQTTRTRRRGAGAPDATSSTAACIWAIMAGSRRCAWPTTSSRAARLGASTAVRSPRSSPPSCSLWFAIANWQRVEIHFWVLTAHASLTVVIAVSAVLGGFVTWLARRRSRSSKKAGE